MRSGVCGVSALSFDGSLGARVAALAEPGQVLVTSTVKDLVAGSGLVFEDRGEHELKGVADRWRLYRVAS